MLKIQKNYKQNFTSREIADAYNDLQDLIDGINLIPYVAIGPIYGICLFLKRSKAYGNKE